MPYRKGKQQLVFNKNVEPADLIIFGLVDGSNIITGVPRASDRNRFLRYLDIFLVEKEGERLFNVLATIAGEKEKLHKKTVKTGALRIYTNPYEGVCLTSVLTRDTDIVYSKITASRRHFGRRERTNSYNVRTSRKTKLVSISHFYVDAILKILRSSGFQLYSALTGIEPIQD